MLRSAYAALAAGPVFDGLQLPSFVVEPDKVVTGLHELASQLVLKLRVEGDKSSFHGAWSFPYVPSL